MNKKGKWIQGWSKDVIAPLELERPSRPLLALMARAARSRRTSYRQIWEMARCDCSLPR
jgi:hypothetical protein